MVRVKPATLTARFYCLRPGARKGGAAVLAGTGVQHYVR